MIALVLVIIYLSVLTFVAAKAKATPNAIKLTEHGSAVLVWLEKNPRPGTPITRRLLTARSKARVWRGLRLAGVYFPFLCIHSKEGPWTIHNPPYDGGFQEDSGFQATYGGEFIALWGSAGHWPIWAQFVSAYRAHHGYHGYGARGYTPWPNTARACGLL